MMRHRMSGGTAMKVVVERNGRRREITGWRKWAIAIPAILFAAVVATAVIVLVLGIAVTAGIVLMILVPALLVCALIAALLMQRRPAN
jgi:hypothetical protein